MRRRPSTGIPFQVEHTVRHGDAETVTPLVRRVVAGNSSPFTYHGTCTYLVGLGEVAVVDPGPDDPSHVEALLAALVPGERITHVLVTHTHSDHSPAARALQARTGATTCGMGQQVRTEDPDTTRVSFDDPEVDTDPSKPLPPRGGDRQFHPDVLLREGDVVAGEGWSLEALHTAGHASNHLCYLLREEHSLFTGDHVMGWSTTVLSPPDGNLGEYLTSLERLLARSGDRRYFPGHGPAIDDPQRMVNALLHHRVERTEQILADLSGGPATIAELVTRLYASARKELWQGAAASVYAHLLHMYESGLVDTVDGSPLVRASRIRTAP